MGFCSSCGTQFVAEAAFCGNCGSAVSAKIPAPAQANPIASTPLIEPITANTTSSPETPVFEQYKAAKPWQKIFLAVIFLGGGGSYIYKFFLSSRSANPSSIVLNASSGVIGREAFSKYLESIEGKPIQVYKGTEARGYFAVSNKALYRCGMANIPSECIHQDRNVGNYAWHETEAAMCIGTQKWVSPTLTVIGNLCVSKVQLDDVGPGEIFYLGTFELEGQSEQHLFTLEPKK